MKILSVNAGSSSLKFQLYEMPEETVLISGTFERIGLPNSFYSIKLNGEKVKKETILNNHKEAFELLVKELLDNNILKSLDEIKGIGHRVVQGGSYFNKSEIATEEVIKKIEELGTLAPLHNPPAVVGIRASIEVFRKAQQVVVFDTAFHQTMKEETYLYALPYEWYTKYQIRKYGAHGTSHKYLVSKMDEILGRTDTKLITCHIGNGASITAIKSGECINTSMGLTPNAGLIMGSRCGDIDASIVPYMIEKLGITPREMDNVLNKESGLIGITGVSTDSRDIEEGIASGNQLCILAQKMYVRRIIDYIAKYYVELGGADAIIFTAGIGENSSLTRKEVIEGLSILGIKLDLEKNNTRSKTVKISASDSSVDVYIIPTDEELMISRDTYNLSK